MNYVFNSAPPTILVVDNFYKYPDDVVNIAEEMEFNEDLRYYKGLRSKPHLMPYVKERFEQLLGVQIIDWMDQPMNGVFQITRPEDPIVFHSDSQDYAAAVYLTKYADFMGTGFYRHKIHGLRRPSNSNLVNEDMYSEFNLLNADNWELVDKVGGVFNRLVIWDAKLIHAAQPYVDKRLVQLYFFSIKK